MNRTVKSLFFGCALAFFLLPKAARGQFTYTTNNGSILITAYSGPGGAVTIPMTITGLPVTGIGNSVFKQSFSLTSVTFPNTLLTIGNNTFDSCIQLKQITLPDSVTNIGTRSFQVCINLTNVILGNGLITISDSAFASDSVLSGVVFGTNLTSIGGHAFDSTGLTSVSVPDNVTSLGGAVFQLCSHLTNAVIGSGVTSVPGNAFSSDSALTSVVIGTNVTSIGSQAFNGCGLISVKIPDSVTFIDISGFNNNPNLTSVLLGYGLSGLGSYAFASCGNLKALYFTGNAPAVASFAFSGDTATVYYLPWQVGWTSSLGGLSTAVWNPPVEPANPIRTGNSFSFTLAGYPFQTVVVEACTNLASTNWVPISTNTLGTGPNLFSDYQWTNQARRFYRVHNQ